MQLALYNTPMAPSLPASLVLKTWESLWSWITPQIVDSDQF